jgi:hypothetical protein
MEQSSTAHTFHRIYTVLNHNIAKEGAKRLFPSSSENPFPAKPQTTHSIVTHTNIELHAKQSKKHHTETKTEPKTPIRTPEPHPQKKIFCTQRTPLPL